MRLAGEVHPSALLLCTVEAVVSSATAQLIPGKREFGFCPPPPPSPPPQCKGKGYRGTCESSDTWPSSPGRKAKAVSARDRKLRKIFAQQEEKHLFNCPCHGRRLYLIDFSPVTDRVYTFAFELTRLSSIDHSSLLLGWHGKRLKCSGAHAAKPS